MDTDRIVGSAKELGGKAQAALGNVAGDGRTEFEGRARQAEGLAQNAIGRASDTIQDVADHAGDYAEDAYRRGEQVVRKAGRYIERQADETPMAAVAGIAVVAFALGYALRSMTER